jgi:hypothetical protein
MRWLAGIALTSAIAYAQQTMPSGIVRGSVVAAADGSLSVRQSDGTVYDCSYDRLTLFQRNHWPIRAADLNGGEPVEILADRKSAVPCYVRMLSVVYPSLPTPRRRALPKEVWRPHGYLSYSGLVVSRDGAMFTIKTAAGLRILRLRADTHYSDATEPLVNKHVFVRAGRNQQGALEAYQVVWGEILAVP